MIALELPMSGSCQVVGCVSRTTVSRDMPSSSKNSAKGANMAQKIRTSTHLLPQFGQRNKVKKNKKTPKREVVEDWEFGPIQIELWLEYA